MKQKDKAKILAKLLFILLHEDRGQIHLYYVKPLGCLRHLHSSVVNKTKYMDTFISHDMRVKEESSKEKS